jgi:AcrR family transcriptional regulator
MRRKSSGKNRNQRTRADWIRVALDAIASGGLKSVMVSPLAERLGVTKGSFYWHFRTRDELVDAALEYWAVDRTRQVIQRLETIHDPRERLRTLMTPPEPGRLVTPLDLVLEGALGDPRVARWRRLHDQLWVDFAARAWQDMGLDPRSARRHALFAYSAHVGLVSMASADPEILSDAEEVAEYADFLRRRLVPE